MAQRLAIGNWKMHTTREEAVALVQGIAKGLGTTPPRGVVVGVAPPFPFLEAVRQVTEGGPIELVAQDCHAEPKGAFTSAVSAPMLASVGVQRVIVGHSERRKVFGDDDALVAAKLRAALEQGLDVILCVGEDLEQREADRQEQVVSEQVRAALGGLARATLARVVLAYEPVWAIGTGKTATPEQAGAMHRFLREEVLTPLQGEDAPLPILYGGSVKPDNANELAQTPGIDGFLVGGASLDANSFLAIVRACAAGDADPRSA